MSVIPPSLPALSDSHSGPSETLLDWLFHVRREDTLNRQAIGQLCLQLPMLVAMAVPVTLLALPWALPWLLLGFGTHALTVPLMRRGHDVAAMHASLASTLWQIVVLSWASGGLGSPPSWFLALLPALPLFVKEHRASGLWAAICTGALVAFAAAAESGVRVPAALDPNWSTHATLLASAGLLSAILWLVLGHNRLADHAQRRLRSLNQELAATAELRSGFLSAMSHEIRTPMNGIIGTTGLLLDTPLDEYQREHLLTLRRSSNLLLELVNDLLDFSRLGVDSLRLETAPFYLPDLSGQIRDLFTHAAKSRGLLIIEEIDDDLPMSLIGDPSRIRQVLYNLVSNAVKFTTEGSVRIRLTCPQDDGRSARIVMEVIDSGVGIHAAARQTIFESFRQGDGSDSRRYGGTGLGLAVCHGLVSAMGGTITVESELGLGSTFRVELDLEIGEGSCDAVDVDLPDEPTGSGVRVLLVEDNPVNQRVSAAMLERLGCTVDLASNGVEAVALAAALPYNLVFMDCAMPQMDGFEASRRIRQTAPNGAQVPIVALTGDSEQATRRRARAAGMTDFLTKPVTLDVLRDVVSAWVDANPSRMVS